MRTWKLLLLALVPGAVGYGVNLLILRPAWVRPFFTAGTDHCHVLRLAGHAVRQSQPPVPLLPAYDPVAQRGEFFSVYLAVPLLR